MCAVSGVETAVERIRARDSSLRSLYVNFKSYKDEDLEELFHLLTTTNNTILFITLIYNHLTDVTGHRIAQYLSTGTRIKRLDLHSNHFTMKTFVAVARALSTNTSLEHLYCVPSMRIIDSSVMVAFCHAIRLNPVRSRTSVWEIFTRDNDFPKILKHAEKSTPPSMLEFLLCSHSPE